MDTIEHGRARGRNDAARHRLVVAVLVMALGALGLPMAASASTSTIGPEAAPASMISITQTVLPPTPICLPAFLSMSYTVVDTPTSFTLNVSLASTLCDPITATAAIYRMPGDGVAWPQQLWETKDVTLQQPGTTSFTFAKTCVPAQFDVINGPTPQTIAPWGEWHGPLLFPLDINTALQHWGSDCNVTTTTTTSTTTTVPTTTTTVPTTTTSVPTTTTSTTTTVPTTTTSTTTVPTTTTTVPTTTTTVPTTTTSTTTTVPTTTTSTTTTVPTTTTSTTTTVPTTTTTVVLVGGQGCTPGYWKQSQHLGNWVGYTTGQSYFVTFGVPQGLRTDLTLLQALGLNGGGDQALARHATAALLNSATSSVSYAFTTQQVIAMVQQAYASGDFTTAKNRLEAANESGCPLARAGTRR